MNTQEMVKLFLSNPSKENFDKIFNQSGYLALSLIYEKLEDKTQLTKYFNLSEGALETLYMCSFGGLKMRVAMAIQGLEKSPTQLVSWYFYRISGNLALMRLKQLELSFDEWKPVIESLEKFQKQNPTTEERFEEIKSTLLHKIEGKAETFEQWEFIYRNSEGAVCRRSFNKLCKLL